MSLYESWLVITTLCVRILDMQKHESAFTLIELMITLAVAAVVLTLGVPSFGRIVEQNQLATNVNLLVQSMTLARSEAVKRNKRTVLCDSSDATACGTSGAFEQGWIVFVDEDGDGGFDSTSEELIYVQGALSENISISANLSTGANNISYQTKGRANRTGNFIICKNNDVTKSRVVVVTMTGRTRLTELTNNGTPEDAEGDAITACI